MASRRTASLKACLDGMPGARAEPMRSVLIYKVMGKMFAVLSVRGEANVILKCDPELAEGLRETYSGVSQRSHLDPRFWISVTLDADVPAREIKRLATHSYEQVCAKLTKKQKADLLRVERVQVVDHPGDAPDENE
jgi:predicted DNA-binding protein (MmcQ/YjbR family)